MKLAAILGTTAVALTMTTAADRAAARVAFATLPGVTVPADDGLITLARGRADDASRNSPDDDGTPDQGPGDAGGDDSSTPGDDDGTSDQGSGDVGSDDSSNSGDDDGTPDQGPGDNGAGSGGGSGNSGSGNSGSGNSGSGNSGSGNSGSGNSGSGHGGHGGDDSGGHGSDHTGLSLPGVVPTLAFAPGLFADDISEDTARRGRGGRSKPRIPGGSGCDDPGDILEHPECAG